MKSVDHAAATHTGFYKIFFSIPILIRMWCLSAWAAETYTEAAVLFRVNLGMSPVEYSAQTCCHITYLSGNALSPLHGWAAFLYSLTWE